MSMLTTLLVFVGIPLLAFVVITLLVMAPSLARGPRYRPGMDWDAEPEWFGAVPAGGSSAPRLRLTGADLSQRQLATDATDERVLTGGDGHDSGGASARW